MTFEEKVGRLFLIGIPGKIVDEETRELLLNIRPGSIILFGRNVENPEQVKKLIDDVTEVLGYKPLISIDQEGGIVTRLTKGFSVSPGAMAISATGNPENARKVARIMASEMKAVGIDWDLAPVVDINSPENPGIGIRSFGSDACTVIEYAGEFTKGLSECGVIPCLKHFPGLGRASVDPHIDLPEIDLTIEELLEKELKPFVEIDAASWMPTHLYMPGVQKERIPASVDPYILTDLVRNKLGYTGVLVADDFFMGGVANYFSPEEAVEKSFAAGMDVVSLCHNPQVQVSAKKYLLEKIKSDKFLQNRMEESLKRIDKLFDLVKSVAPEEFKSIGSLENMKLMDSISSEAIKVLSNEDSIIPLKEIDNIITIRLSRLVEVEEQKQGVPWIASTIAHEYRSELLVFDHGQKDYSKILEKATGKVNIAFTENAHLKNDERNFVENLSKVSGKFLLIAIRNPYDGNIKGVKNSIASYGYTNSLQLSLYKTITGKAHYRKTEKS